MPLLEARGLTRLFGGLAALRDVDLDVHEGEILGLIGPNGAGKTTLFNLLSGALPPTRGSLRFGGRSLLGLRPSAVCRLGIARTHQIVRPFASLSVYENVLVGLRFGRAKRGGAARGDVEPILERMGLAEHAGRKASELPLPGRKRLEIARAYAARPSLLLLDEVAAGLNPRELADTVTLIRGLRDEGLTIVYVEHVMPAVMSLCERIVVLDHGETLAEGSPEQVVSDERVVRAYLGEPTA